MTALGFTAAREQDVFKIGAEPSSFQTSSVLSGDEARNFYENLTRHNKRPDAGAKNARNRASDRRARGRVRAAEMRRVQTDSVGERRSSGEMNQSRAEATRETSSSGRCTELQGLRLLHCAQDGDLSGLKELLSKGVDINFQDSFLWTSVMCASWSGQRAAVRLLLKHGAAWVGVVDTQGRDAKDLAVEAGHSGVLEEFETYERSTLTERQPDSSASRWCDVCRTEYSSSLSSHLSSTLHQFSLRHPPPTPYYCLPPSANSYKMMVRCGWRPGTGLGPEGEGPKQPVSTVLKRDQKGLGYGQQKRAKVTHFQARDCDAVKPPFKEKEERERKGKRKEEGSRKEQRDRNWERDFRTSFYL